MSVSTLAETVDGRYRHEAFFYGDDHEFLRGTLDFIHEAVAGDEPILVVLSDDKIAELRHQLGGEAERVCFADMTEVGANPARIIPTWQDFLVGQARPGRRVRGIGEPIWASRTADELVECERHEALLNVAFANPDFWLLCPYDTATLEESVVDEARRNHPFVRDRGFATSSASYLGDRAVAAPFDRPLSEPPSSATLFAFHRGNLSDVRTIVEEFAVAAGLIESRTADLVLAVYEISSNSVQHGGGRGSVRIWSEDSGVVCEVRDAGSLTDPMLGRVRPQAHASGGRGLWLANQLCDLVQTRSFATETATRLHMHSKTLGH